MTTAIAFFQPGWADWEAGPVLAVLREHFAVSVKIATPDGGDQTSIGGVTARADLAFVDVKPTDADVFLVIGSDAWPGFEDEAFFTLLGEALAEDRIVGAICAGTVAAARAGLFDGRAHTSNGGAWLATHAPDYAGRAGYVETSRAVTAGKLVSAGGLAPQTFATAIARLVAPQAEEAIAGYEAMVSAEWSAA